MGIPPKLIYRLDIIPITIQAGFFAGNDKLILKFMWKFKGSPKNQMVLNKNKAEGHTFLDLKTDYKARVSKQCYWHNDI